MPALARRTPPQKLNTTCFSTKSLSVVGPMLPAEAPPRVAGWSDILIYTDPRRGVSYSWRATVPLRSATHTLDQLVPPRVHGPLRENVYNRYPCAFPRAGPSTI